MKSRIRIRLALLASLAVSPLVVAQNSNDGSTDDSPSESLEEIVVTGSRIISSNLTSPIPTQVIDMAEIEASGTVDLGEVIEQLPGVFLGISPSNSLLSTQNSGLSTIDLRGLSTNRTLTLIDGRRVVSNSGSAQRVDTATIPTGFIDRVDITTGGASAVYGSDAIAGVANIVLVDDFEGFELETRYEDSADGGRESPSLNVLWGTNLASGRGNVMIGANWENKESLFASERDYARSNLEIDLETGELEPNLSSTLDGGRFEGDAWNNGGVWQNDQPGVNPFDGNVYCLDDGRVPACDDYQEALDGWDFRPFSMLFPERERWSTLVKGKFDLTDTLTASAMLHYSETDTKSERAPASLNDANTFGPFDDDERIGDIPDEIETAPGSGVFITNPLIHPAVLDTLSGTVDWRRRAVEVGNRDRSSNRVTQRVSLGLDGEINDNWSFSTYVGRGVYEQNQRKNNEINRQNVQFAINIVGDPSSPGGLRCIDDAAVAAGCVPLDVFGVGSISPEAADYIRHTIMLNQELTQTTASFVASGDLWKLPAGQVQMATGIDYRKEEQQTTGDPVTNAGLTSSSSLLNVDAEFDVTEAFVEFSVPLVADKPGIHALDLTTAYRVADYNTIGDVSSWNFGLSYAPVPDLRIRAQVSQAQRAPDITELFSPQRSDFDSFNDPCDGVTATSAGIVDDNCRTDPGIAAAIATDGEFNQDGSSIFGPNQGNLDLIEETADTTTFGFVFTPSVLEGFSFIADYYKIEVEDVIASVDSQLAGELCYSDINFETNVFCDSITRDVDGQVSRIVNQVENLNSLTSEGIDVTVRLDFSVPRVPGDFESKIVYAHIIKNETAFDGPDGEVIDDFAGEVGLPEHEYRWSLRWRPNERWSIRYRLKYQGTVLDDNDPDPEDIFGFKRFEAVLDHDIYASYSFGTEHDYRVFAGINNIENQTGPYLPDGYESGSNSNVNSSYDRVGRVFYAGFKFEW